MGGNIDGSFPGRVPFLWGVVGVECGTLLGPEGAALCWFSFGSGFRPETHTAGVSRVRWVSVGSGVRWGVCELDSGCEHLVSFRLLLCSV